MIGAFRTQFQELLGAAASSAEATGLCIEDHPTQFSTGLIIGVAEDREESDSHLQEATALHTALPF